VRRGEVLRTVDWQLDDETASSAIAFSADAQLLASGHVNGQVRLWEAHTGNRLSDLTEHEKAITALAFSPQNTALASADQNNVILRQVPTGKPLYWLPNPGLPVHALAFSPDGTLLVTGAQGWDADSSSNRGIIVFWDVETGEVVDRYEQYLGPVETVGFTPAGCPVAAWLSWDDSVTLWDIKGERVIRKFRPPSDYTASIAFSPDGRTLATGSPNGTAVLWDIASGKPLKTLRGYTRQLSVLAFSPDSHLLVLPDYGRVLLLEVPQR
jgi:WD40 repeat protein